MKLIGPVSKDSHSARRMQSEQHSLYQEQNVKTTPSSYDVARPLF